MKLLSLLLVCSISGIAFSQENNKKIHISQDLELIKISENSYIHVSYTESSQFGRFPSNGLVFIEDGKAFLFDTPMSEELTTTLLSYLEDSMKIRIIGFVTNDWHGDSMGGLNIIKNSGIPSYANELTREIAGSKELPIPDHGFKDSLTLELEEKQIICHFLGAAHTLDNIVVWIPSERILFADCMVKSINSKNLGFTGDGDLKAYPETLKKLKAKYPNAKVVIPGHGDFGGIELIEHTLKLALGK